MSLLFSNPSSMVNFIVHKGDIFVDGNTVYIAKVSGYPTNIYPKADNSINGIFYTIYDSSEGGYSFPIFKTSSDEINETINNVKSIKYDSPYYYYHESYLEGRMPLPKGLVCLIDDKYYVTTSACTMMNLLSCITPISVTTKNNVLGWTYNLDYKIGDFVIYDGYVYACTQDHKSLNSPDSITDSVYWEKYVEARTTKLDYVWAYQLLTLMPMMIFDKQDTFVSNFVDSYVTETVAKRLPVIEDLYNGVQHWLYFALPIAQSIGESVHGVAPYRPKINDWHTLLSAITFVGDICVGCNKTRTSTKKSPPYNVGITERNGGYNLTKYCPYLGSTLIIPEANYISPSTVDAYYAGQVFSDGTHIYLVWSSQIGSLSSVSIKVPNTSIINQDTIFFAPPTDWFSAKYTIEVDETNKYTGLPTGHKIKQTISPGASIGFRGDVYSNVVGTKLNQTPPTCPNLAHSDSKYVFSTQAQSEDEAHLPYASVSQLRSVILTNHNYLVINNVKQTETTYKNGVKSSSTTSRLRDIRYPCKGRFVGEFNIDYSMTTDAVIGQNDWSTRALVDVYYVLRDDSRYGNIDKWLDDETYTVWCFRTNICTKEIISMNTDTEQYVSKYGLNPKKRVSIKGVSVPVSSLKGYDNLPPKMKEALKDVTVHVPPKSDPDVPEKVYNHNHTSIIDLPDPVTKKPMAKAEKQPDGTYEVKPNIKKGNTNKEKDTEETKPCALGETSSLYIANEDGGSWDDVNKSIIATYYNNVLVYSSKELAEADRKNTYFYFNSARKVIFHENGKDVKAVGDETANGETVSFYLDCLDIISKHQNGSTYSINKGTYWVYNGNIYKASISFSGATAPAVNKYNFTWVGKYLNDAHSCNDVSNLPILSEDELICGVKAGNKVIVEDKNNDGVIIDVVSPAPKGQLKLDDQIIIGKVKKDVYSKEATLENGVDVNYRENSVFVTDTHDTDVSTAEYGQGTLFYIENTKTAYYATKTCTYEEIYRVCNIEYYVYKNNDHCQLFHGIKYLIYKDTGRNEHIKIYKRKSYAIVNKNSPEYYFEGDDVYRKVDDIAERDKTADPLVARFSNEVLVWLEDKDREDKPNDKCKDYGIYDNDTLIWYETTFQLLHENVYYMYKNKVYRTHQDSVTYKEFGDLNYSGLYGQLYAQGKMLIWYCPPVVKLIAGTVFKYSTKIYVATGDISVEDWEKVDFSKLSVKQIGFIEEHTQDCKLIYGDIVLYDTEYPLCYIFNTGEKVDITSHVYADIEIFNAVSNETIVQVVNPSNKDAITNSIGSHTIIATKNIQDSTGTYRWLFHSFDTTAEIVNNYLYNKDEDAIYFSEDTCKIIKIYGYYVKLHEFICPIDCPFPYGITHKIYRLKNDKIYNNNEYIFRELVYYTEKYAKNESYFLNGDHIYYKDKNGDNSVVARYVNGELISYSCYIDENHTEQLFEPIGLYEKSLDMFFFYTTMIEKIYSGAVFIDESEIYLAKTNIKDTQSINLSMHKNIGTMAARDNIPVFNYIYKNIPTLYYKETNTKKNTDFVYRIIDNNQRIAVGVYGVYRLNIKPHVKDFALSLSEYPVNCCYKLRVGDLVYTGIDILNPKIGDKIYEIINEICANEFIPQSPTTHTQQKEICYVMAIDCVGKLVWVFDYYVDNEYLSKTFVEIKNESKNVSNIMFYKCYISEVDGHKYCVWQEVCSLVGCNKPLGLTADIPVKLPTYVGVTEQRVWEKVFTGDTIKLKGCEMNIRTWSMYKVQLGGESSNKIPYNKDYTYTWNYITKDFTIVDNATEKTIYSKSNCETFSDLGINLDTVVSCNFIFITKNKFVESGLIPVKEKRVMQTAVPEKFELGVDNTYRADRVRPYEKTDADNPTNKIYHVINNPKIEGNYNIKLKPHISTNNTEGSSTEDNKINVIMNEVFNKYGETTYLLQTRQLPSNYLYLSDAYTPFTIVDTKKKLKVTQVKLSITLAELSICLYQMLLPIDRVGEVNNNRPVYEPWLVWGFYKLIYSKGTKAEDVPIIYPIFDLSPIYG